MENYLAGILYNVCDYTYTYEIEKLCMNCLYINQPVPPYASGNSAAKWFQEQEMIRISSHACFQILLNLYCICILCC